MEGSEKQIINILQNTKPFEYFHDGASKLGYYDPASKIFIGQIKDSGLVKTVINNVGPNYIKNLISK